jgi:Collagen triple helix repeat (20 copies)
MHKLLRLPSPAMVVACLALFMAGTGAGVAVIKALPRNSVGTAQLKANAVNSSKVKDRSLKAVDFASGQIPKGPKGDTGATGPKGDTGAAGATGAAGPAGATGAAGPAGAQGAPGLSGLVSVESTHVDLADGYYVSPTAYCPAGTKVVGTGFYNQDYVGFVKAYGTFVGGWFENYSGVTGTVYVQAICASVATTSASSVTASSIKSERQRFEADVAKAKADIRTDSR